MKPKNFVARGITVLSLALVMAGTATIQARAQDKLVLSLDTALLFSLNNNPDINIVEEQKIQSGYAIDEARSVYYPQLSVSASAGREYNDPASFKPGDAHTGTGNTNNSNEYTVSVNQLIFDGFATPAEIKRRKQLYQSAEYQSAIVQENIILDTAEAYLDVYRYQRTLEQAEFFVDRLAAITRKVELMVEAGAENLAKAKYAQSRLTFARSERTDTTSSLANAITDLEFLTGKLPPFVAKKPELVDILGADIETYMELALEKNTNLLLNESDKSALEYELRKTRGQYYPSVSMLLEYNQSEDLGGEVGGDTSAAALMQMNYKIFDGFGRRATKNRVKSEITEISYRADRLERDIRQQIKTAYNQIQSLEEELMIVEEEIETNEELQALYREQFELGEGDIINLIEGEERLFASRTRKYQVQSAIIFNALELIRQIGLLDKHRFCATC